MRFSYIADNCVNGQNHFGKPRHSRMFKGHTVSKNKSLVITQNLGAYEWKNQPWIFPSGICYSHHYGYTRRRAQYRWPQPGIMWKQQAPHVIQHVRACDTKEKKLKWNTHVYIYMYIWMYIEATQSYKQTKLRVVGMGLKTMVVSKGHRGQEEGLPRWGAS